MSKLDIMYHHNSDEWETPQDLYDELDREFHFTLDPCCSEENRKCTKYFTKAENGLMQSWGGQTVFCNPPYSQAAQWVEKAAGENATTVMLLPARTDTRWFHEYIYHHAEIRFIKGRLKFSGAKNSAPFPSMIVIFRNMEQKT